MIIKVIRPDSKLENLFDCTMFENNIIDNALNLEFYEGQKFLDQMIIEFTCKVFVMENGRTIDTIHFDPKQMKAKPNTPLKTTTNDTCVDYTYPQLSCNSNDTDVLEHVQ